MALSNLYAPSPSEVGYGYVTVPMAADAVIYGGGIVSVNSDGYAVAGSDTAGDTVVGKAYIAGGTVVDNTGGDDGDLFIVVKLSLGHIGYIYDNDATHPLTQAAAFQTTCYVVDDHTVGVSSTHSIVAGTFLGFPRDNKGAAITTKAIVRFAN